MLDIVTKKVARTDGRKLRKALKQSLRLRAFAHAGRTNENNPSGFPEAHARPTRRVGDCEFKARKSEERKLEQRHEGKPRMGM